MTEEPKATIYERPDGYRIKSILSGHTRLHDYEILSVLDHDPDLAELKVLRELCRLQVKKVWLCIVSDLSSTASIVSDTLDEHKELDSTLGRAIPHLLSIREQLRNNIERGVEDDREDPVGSAKEELKRYWERFYSHKRPGEKTE